MCQRRCVNARFHSGQQLVSQLQNQNPELFNSLRQQMGGIARAPGDGANPGADGTPPNNQPQPPPPSQ